MKKILTSMAALCAAALAYSQNLDPVVEVTNAFKREAEGIEKPSQLLPLPDSVSRFNLDFDYSVKSKPYNGAYEFNPYLVEMHPSAMPSGEHKLYLSAGAGYALRPELDVFWNPVRRKNIRADIYATHRSYIGNYRNIVVGSGPLEYDGTSAGDGINANTVAGASFLYGYRSGIFTADISYRNIAASDLFADESYSFNPVRLHHRGQAKLRVKGGNKFKYEAGTRFGMGGYEGNNEQFMAADLHLSTKVFKTVLSIDGALDAVSYADGMAAKWEIVPHYVRTRGRLSTSIGVKLSGVMHTNVEDYEYKPAFIFPDVHIDFALFRRALVLQAGATGGNKMHTYDSLLGANPYLAGYYWTRDVSVERFNVWAGARGSIAGRFSYDAKVGYQWMDNAFGWSYFSDLTPTMVYVSPLKTFYVDVVAGWKSSSWDISANVHYGNTPMPRLKTEVEKNVFAPAPFLARGHVLYTWNGRIKGGATIEARSAMKGKNPVPAYQDLGLVAEYAFSRNITFWLKGGNLLGQSIQRIPFHAEGGIYAVAGLRMVL